MELKPEISITLKEYFEKKINTEMDYYSSSRAAKEIKIQVLLIHDENDDEVNVKAAYKIYKNLENSELMVTKGLGHIKILGNSEVIKRIVAYKKT